MPKRNIIWIVAIVTATATAMWLSRSDPNAPSPPGVERFGRLAKIVASIERDYYRPLDSERLNELIEIEGLGGVESLDEFSTYVRPERVEAFKQRMAGKGRGLGLRTRQARTGPPIVTAVMYNSPAYRAGIQVDWRIVRIQGHDVGQLRPSEIREILQPALGESVSLTLYAANAANLDEENTVTLTSEKFGVESVTGLYHLRRDSRWARRWAWILDQSNAIAYIHVREFVGNTVERFDEAFRAAAAGQNPRGLVLDLRGNPGGQSSAAIRLADMFLAEGLIVRMLGRKDDGRIPEHGKRYSAHRRGTLDGIPLVVLVDERTASGAELVAGALWANHRAVLVGTPTRGKWCAQSMIELEGGLGLLNLTTSYFVFSRPVPRHLTPHGQIPPIRPHEIVRIDPDKRRDLAAARDEARRPPAPAAGDKPTTAPATTRKITPLDRLLMFDSQLHRARELLREPKEYSGLLEAERLRAKRQAEGEKVLPPDGHRNPGDD